MSVFKLEPKQPAPQTNGHVNGVAKQTNGHLSQNHEDTEEALLFTSESVGEGHPGK